MNFFFRPFLLRAAGLVLLPLTVASLAQPPPTAEPSVPPPPAAAEPSTPTAPRPEATPADPNQPVNGITIPDGTPEEEIAILRRDYERADEDTREMMRAVATVAILEQMR